jgi:hypothetical protein
MRRGLQIADCRLQIVVAVEDSKQFVDAFATGGGFGLRVAFERRADRFRHCIGWWEQGRFVPLLESIEGDASQPWPPSPPLQQLHFEPRERRGSVALLVGMAGRSHWSLSVEPDAEAPALLFDAACRVSGPAEQLGSRYRLLAAQWTQDAHTITLPSRDSGACIVVEAIAGTLALDASARELILRPIISGTTIRWQYRVLRDG